MGYLDYILDIDWKSSFVELLAGDDDFELKRVVVEEWPSNQVDKSFFVVESL